MKNHHKNEYVIFDCDDVLADTRLIFQKGVEEILGEPIDINEWKHWELNKNHPEITWDKFNEWIYDTRALERIQPNEDAMHVVEHCKSLGYRTGIVTARAYYPKAMKVTRQWVNKHKLPIDQIYCVSPEVDKRLTLDALKYPVKIYVDDHPEHIISAQLSDNVDKPIILTRPWNDTHDIEHRIDELADVIDHF